MSDTNSGSVNEWVAVAADDIEWVEGPWGETAIVWGDASTGPYGSFNRFAAGTVIPPHTHSHDNQLIVVEGTIYNYRVDDDDATRAIAYPAGSFVHETADVVHVLAVADDAPATVYLTQSGPLDLNLAEQDDPGHG